jgi:hypothetical protein
MIPSPIFFTILPPFRFENFPRKEKSGNQSFPYLQRIAFSQAPPGWFLERVPFLGSVLKKLRLQEEKTFSFFRLIPPKEN